ncbi:unnamed protein product [Urochloa humidicola]
METAQEREVQLLQGRQAWPFHMMGMGMAATATAGGCFDGYGHGGGIGSDCFVLGWEQPPAPAPFGCFGLLAADVHDLFPLFAGMESPLPVSSSALAAPAPPAPPPAHDVAAAIPGELDDLLLNFWDASCHDGDVGEQQKATQQQELELGAFNSTCVTHEQTTTTTTCAAAAATTNSFFHYDDDGDDPLSSIFCTGPTPPPLPAEEAVVFQHAPAAEPEPLLSSSSSSNCQVGAQAQAQGPTATPWTPPPPRSSTSASTTTPSLKRATREAAESSDQAAAECSQESESSKRRRTEAAPSSASSARVLCPFALLKPDGLDGGATLADINARILMRPSRPVRHPVGEFACAPRVSADQPGLSGKVVSSFTRLHTPGRGTITIIRTRG